MRAKRIMCPAPLCVDTMRVLGHGDQFGEQTAFVFSKGALSGMMTVCLAWVRLAHYMCQITWCPSTLMNHQASLRRISIRRIWSIFNADDQSLIDVEVEKYPPPLDGQLPHLYNTLTGKIAFRPKITNEHDVLMKMPIMKSFPHTSHLTNWYAILESENNKWDWRRCCVTSV